MMFNAHYKACWYNNYMYLALSFSALHISNHDLQDGALVVRAMRIFFTVVCHHTWFASMHAFYFSVSHGAINTANNHHVPPSLFCGCCANLPFYTIVIKCVSVNPGRSAFYIVYIYQTPAISFHPHSRGLQ